MRTSQMLIPPCGKIRVKLKSSATGSCAGRDDSEDGRRHLHVSAARIARDSQDRGHRARRDEPSGRAGSAHADCLSCRVVA
jgi:hypothetical protein